MARTLGQSYVLMVMTVCVGANSEAGFDAFIQKYDRPYKQGDAEFAMRLSLFQHRVREMHAQNAQPESWVAVVNKFTDRTEKERSQMLGWRHIKGARQEAPAGAAGLDEVSASAAIPEHVDWSHKLKMSSKIPDQGGCGSCWAVTSASILDAHYEIYQGDDGNKAFSAQEIVNCVQNPKHCGGTGGCGGATAELAMQWVMDHGLSSQEKIPYEGEDAECKKKASFLTESGATRQKGAGAGGASIGMRGWETLPINEYRPLMQAVASKGPVAVSTASSSWFGYGSGVKKHCDETVINHAVSLFGYGATDDGTKYWHIRNSWGDDWGEKGFIRLGRHDDEESRCFADKTPSEGTGCDGGPSEVKCCGTCGILYDSVVPHFDQKGKKAGDADDDETDDDSEVSSHGKVMRKESSQ